MSIPSAFCSLACLTAEFGKQIHNGNPSRLVQIREDGGVNGKISELTGLLGSLECERVYNRIKKVNSDFQILSMGMSNDYKIAIEAGSNMIRIGSLIFGSRN